MSTRNLGKISPTFEGDYNPAREYNYLEVVYFDGSSFVSLINDNNTEPIDDKVNWAMVARHGQDFKFEDFTPEQIELLQQPAIESAQLADIATQNANTATQNANQAASNANQATQDANQATASANASASTASNAATNANTATNNANNAALDAIQATTNANNAAQNANNARGWNPQFVFESDGANRIVKKLNAWIGGTGTTPTTNVGQYVTDAGTYTTNKSNGANFKGAQGIQGIQGIQGFNGWNPLMGFESDGADRIVQKLVDWIGGTGTKPTQYIGQYVTDAGTFTTVKANGANFKGAQSDNLISEYVHSGNLEITVSSIDYTTNTFNSTNHGLVNGDRVAFNITNDCNVLTQTPFSQMWIADSSNGGYFVTNATANTFQLTLTNGGAVMILNNRVGNDFTKWKIERVSPNSNITFNNLNVKSLRCRILGGCHRTVRYVLNNTGVYTGYKNTGVSGIIIADRGALYGSIEIDVDIVNSCDLINVNLKFIGLNDSSTNLDYFTDNLLIKPTRTSPITTIPSINLSQLRPFNGTIIQILKQ